MEIQQQLIQACKNGRISEIKYILYNNIDYNIHSCNEYIFRTACEYGQINIVKYLIDTYSNIDIHAENEYSFRWSCIHGHIKIAQYLINYCEYINSKINIYCDIYRLFDIIACVFYGPLILEFMNSLIKHNYRTEHFTGSIQINKRTTIFFTQKYIKYNSIICYNYIYNNILCQFYKNNNIKLNYCYMIFININ